MYKTLVYPLVNGNI